MRHDKIVPGAILITLGVIFLLSSFGIIHIHLWNILHLWPIFLLIAGINLIFAHNHSAWAAILKVGVVILGVCLLFFGNFNNRFIFWPHYSYHYNDNGRDDDDDDDDNGKGITKIEGSSTFNAPYSADARIAKLNVSGGGAEYTLSDTTSQLFEAVTKEYGSSYEFSHHSEDSVYVLDFNMKSNHNFHFGHNKANSATFKLNTKPVWDIDITAGAAELNFDLTRFKVRNLKIGGGAASFDIKIGQPLDVTSLEISTGMAGVNIAIPQNAACKIDSNSGFSSNTFTGFNKNDDGDYETPGFNNAAKKILIHINGGMSSFKVSRY